MGRLDGLVGSSRAMQRLYDLVTRVARTDATVLVSGETGTGKELVARAIHRLGRRADRPFVALNCAAVQPSLVESELFGHEPGSFTGASRRRKGCFELANGGTLFLDEITEMSTELQTRLLRVLETDEFRRVGGERSIRVDVRLVAATNRDADAAVRDGELREDLYYRLEVFPIRVPPLRERERDIQMLASHFLAALDEGADAPKSFHPDALARLRAHAWPGNVRELRNVVERAHILATGATIDPDHVDLPSDTTPPTDRVVEIVPGTPIAEMEKRLVVATLEHTSGDKREAAKLLGISLKTLYNRLNSYGMGRQSAAVARGAAR
ncbi:MAG: sigma-54 dependent transcriptional regulator [Planctomycetota bacterium]